MTFVDSRARDLWARTRVHLWPGRYVLASLPRRHAAGAAAIPPAPEDFFALLVERDEVSLTLSEMAWAVHPLRPEARAESSPWRVVTFDIELALDVTGYLAPAAAALAAARLAIVPQCGYSRDHILVPDDRVDEALATVHALIEAARREP